MADHQATNHKKSPGHHSQNKGPAITTTSSATSRTNQSERRHGPKRNINNSKNGQKRNHTTTTTTTSEEKNLSHALSWALRHQGPAIGLSMTPDGYVPVSQIITSSHPRLHKKNKKNKAASPITLTQIQDVVRSSDKQRFQLDFRPASAYPKEVVAESFRVIPATTTIPAMTCRCS